MTNRFTIVEDRAGTTGYQPRGAALELWRFKGPSVIISGPAETGKTYACCQKLDALLWKYPGAQAVIVRKVRDTMHGSVLSTYRNKVLGKETPVRTYGGEKAEWYDYPNGSRLWVAGMDNPGKALSSERDFIYANQAEELAIEDWETLTTRATGRAGNTPYPQVIGDCNPGPPHHWIKKRAGLKMLESRHEDNPTLWDAVKGQWTEQGRRTLAILDALTGARKERLRFGRWAQAEGAVYEGWDERHHLIDPRPIPPSWVRYWAIDFGFTNPLVLQWYALDPDDGLHLYRECYRTGWLVEDMAREALLLSEGEPRPRAVICDHDAEDRATFERHSGLRTTPADKGVTAGIQDVAERLIIRANGRPRLFVHRGALAHEADDGLTTSRKPVCTAEEFSGYVWNDKIAKEAPVKENDHGCFIAGTLIETARGSVSIEQVTTADRVLTREGYRAVLACGMTNPAARVMTLHLPGGGVLTGTPNHPVYIDGVGFVRMDTVRYGDGILSPSESPSWKSCRCRDRNESCECGSRVSSTAAIRRANSRRTGTTSEQVPAMFERDDRHCTATSGFTTTSRFQMGTRSTTSTATRSTTRSATCNCLPLPNMLSGIAPRVLSGPAECSLSDPRFIRRCLPVRPYGTAPTLVGNGTGNTVARWPQECPTWHVSANAAETSTQPRRTRSAPPGSVRTTVDPLPERHPGLMTRIGSAERVGTYFGATSTLPPGPVPVPALIAAVSEPRVHPVFNLTVADTPEYFANGVLVHNCDALRYLCRYLAAGRSADTENPYGEFPAASGPAPGVFRGGVSPWRGSDGAGVFRGGSSDGVFRG